ncbi:hypothetical protein ACFPME_12100 [Rhodanobacter umsongensis]|uniref:Ribbon-helix-helix protein CopG domain-containing protein n=1 Tax=Rhodanobacter umsongensis TaxID=633153 RepID=A0ABW0JN43_9GAMM
MPAKKSSATTARTLKARVSDASMLRKLDALKVQHGLNESSLLREALRDYVDRERMRDEIAAMDRRFGATVDRLIKFDTADAKANIFRPEDLIMSTQWHDLDNNASNVLRTASRSL